MIAGVRYVNIPVSVCGYAFRSREVAEALAFPAQLADEVAVRVKDVDAMFPLICLRTWVND